ncbi:MAG: serine--tRNA ligase [Spirochaetales bacterium]|nr:serine--tRNA ligase [Leptospiraceae bacterium]MCP5483418.1 serine--tRNA ligase [Spirochaetales bacterium]MCP5486779.1 serine--tRNA ligase [Spirochaetales bacterium]
MLDLKRIEENPGELTAMLKRRHADSIDIGALLEIIEQRKTTQQELDSARSERNQASKAIGGLIAEGKQEEAERRKAQVRSLGDHIAELETRYESLTARVQESVLDLPNWIDPEVPTGKDAEDNQVLRVEGKRPSFDFKPLPHFEIGEKLGILDFEGGVRLAGSRFYSYRGLAARLERAIINFMLDLHTTHSGYEEVFVPMLIADEGMYTTGQFPKFRGEYYSLDRDGLSLIPTAEVPLVNLYRDQIVPEEDLPIAVTAATSCFRREAGAAGKDTRGLVRVHQFQKVELVRLVHPEKSADAHEAMLGHAEDVLRRLGLHYRVVLLCSGDMGATAVRTYDIEVWMPGLDRWLEISSVSNCEEYQARRGKIRFKGKQSKDRPAFVHTLNGSGVAAGRCMIAIMENFQRADGTFDVPAALRPYLEANI